MATHKPPPTYEGEALNVLAYEFSFSDREQSDTKIKARLRRKKLGAFDAERIGGLRAFKDELQKEIGLYAKSAYFTDPHPDPTRYAEMQDFDVARLIGDLSEKYPEIPKAEIESFVPFAVFLYYLK